MLTNTLFLSKKDLPITLYSMLIIFKSLVQFLYKQHPKIQSLEISTLQSLMVLAGFNIMSSIYQNFYLRNGRVRIFLPVDQQFRLFSTIQDIFIVPINKERTESLIQVKILSFQQLLWIKRAMILLRDYIGQQFHNEFKMSWPITYLNSSSAIKYIRSTIKMFISLMIVNPTKHPSKFLYNLQMRIGLL